MTTRKIFQKSIICVLTLALALGLMPSVSGMFGAIKAYANSNGGAAANTSSISTYATKAQLADDTFAPNSSGVATNIGKINFGSFTWYLLGGDSKIEGDNAVIFATSQIASGMFNLDTGDSKNPGSDYGTYPEGSSIETVWGNHYGSSRHRDTLKSAASNTAYFSAKQQSMMNATTVTTKDIKNDVDYTTADKLYALASDGEYESKIIKAGTDDNKILSMGTYWSSGSFFWLRTPSTYASRSVIGPIPGRGCVAQQVNNIAGLTRPASNLNLSDVAFSSAAKAASSEAEVGGTITTENNAAAMDLRLEAKASETPVTINQIGSLSCDNDAGTISATKGSSSDVVSLVIQGKNGDTDWYYSKQINGTETVDKAAIAAAVDDTAVTSDDIDLAQCKVWLETTADDGMAYAVRLTRTITTSLIGNYASHGSIDEGRTVAQGDDITINYQADAGYNVSKIEIDGVRTTDVSAYQNSYTFKNVGQNHDIAIIFGITRYSIKYNLDGGTNAKINLSGYTVETPSFTFADATKTDYTFSGWFDADENKVEGIAKGSRTGDLELTARWKATDYKITYNLGDGATNANTNPSSYTVENETITLADPTRSGYEFLGWTGSNGNTPQKNVTIAAGSSGAKTYTANWQAIDYDITYNLDGGTNATSNPKKYNVETADIVFATPEKDGHTFGGWFDADNKQVTGIAKGSRTGNLALTAKWNANKCTVKFIDWDGTELKTEEIEYGKAATAPANPTRIGYTFTGWSADFGKILDNTTITAQYEINKYKIIFNANGGNFEGVDTKEVQVEYGKTVAAPEPAPTRAGYDFIKWTTDAAGQNEYNFDTLIDDDKTLYAQWKVIDYTITYNVGDGATNAASNPQTYNVETNNIVLAAPTKTGYVFSGWFDVDNKRVTGIAKGSRTGDLELTAQWEKRPVTSFATSSFDCLVQKDGKSVYIKVHSKKIKKLTVPKTVKDSDGNVYKVVGIAKAGFKNCKKLTKVRGGKNITTINANAFAGCKKLKNFKCTSKSLKRIGKNAFAKTSKLTKITINKTTKLKTVKKAFKKAGKNNGKKLIIKVKSSKKKAYRKLILKKGGNKKLKVK